MVTVTRNSAHVLGDSIQSVVCQTYPDIEHVIVDGGSTDETASVVKKFGTKKTVFKSEADAGIYDGMNRGLALATGEIVGFLNSDDVLAGPHVLAQVARSFAVSSPDVVYGDLEYVSNRDLSKIVRRWRSGGFAARRLRWGWMPPHPAFYAKRQLLEKVGGFDMSFGISGDYDLMVRMLLLRDVVVTYVPGVFVRMRTGGVSNESLFALIRKSREDLLVARRNGLGGSSTVFCKIVRKLPQFI